MIIRKDFCNDTRRCGKLGYFNNYLLSDLESDQISQNKAHSFVMCTDAAGGWTRSLWPFKIWGITIIWNCFILSSGRVKNRGLFGELLASLGNDLGAFLSWGCGANNSQIQLPTCMSPFSSSVDCRRCHKFHKAAASKGHKPPTVPLHNRSCPRAHQWVLKAMVPSNASFACEELLSRMGYYNGHTIFSRLSPSVPPSNYQSKWKSRGKDIRNPR